MKYKYILFDLDGTITESGPGIMNSVEYALNKMNREVGDRDTLKKFIGPPLTESMEKYYGMSEEEALLGVKYYREYYAVKGIFENSVYEGLANDDRVVMVADRNSDIYGAKENGIQVIGVLYGYGDLAELQSAGADYIAKMPEEIAQIIGRCNHERV